MQPSPSSPEARAAASPSGPPEAADTPRLMIYNCGNITFATRTVAGEATLFAPGLLETIELKRTEAASGERYEGGGTVFWDKGNVATFDVRGQVFADCPANVSASLRAQAQSRGAIVWATGNGPSWTLEITPQQLTLTTEPGTRRNEFPYRAPEESGNRSHYQSVFGTYRSAVGTQEIMAVVVDATCNDSLSGEALSVTVAVTFEQRTLYGCGEVFPLNVPRPR